MKKTITLMFGLLLTAMAFAQGGQKLNLVVGDFTGDYSRDQRENVIRELCKAHRANVIEKGCYDALPAEVRAKMNIDAVITAKCAIKTERKEVEKYEKGGKKKGVEFSTQFTTQMTFTNPKTGQKILEPLFESNATEDTRDESINKALAVGHTKGKQTFVIVQLLTLDEYLQEKYPMRATIATVNESKKGKAEYVTINIGGKSAVYRGQTFEVIEDNGGKEKRWGKLRVREINSDTTATCSVEKGGKDIMKAMENGDVNVISYVQALSLNGIVRVEQEAPVLNISNPDDVKKRNVAFGTITGNPPAEFTNAVKKNMKDNRRINAFEMGAANCPAASTLDGIALGYFTGMHSSSRLVKADEELLVLKDYTEYKTWVGWFLFIVNPQTGEIMYCGNESHTATSDKSAAEAKETAILVASDITSSSYNAYPLIGTIATIDESNSDQDKAKMVTIDLGSDYPIYTGLRFDVYSEDAANGWEKIGRIEVTEITDGTHASCKVKKGGDEIRKALEEGLPIRITTFILKEFFDIW